MKSSVLPRSSVWSLVACASLAPLLGGCEKKPTAAEIEEVRRVQEATPVPTPQPGAWMYDKSRKSPLDEKPRR